MAKRGEPLERLVATLEKALVDDKSTSIESPKRLRDRTTGQLREHDVILTIRREHHEFKVAIECRDRSRPVTVNQVEAFEAKCRDTGINQGIIVSTSGFHDTARSKADHLKIRCLDIEEAVQFDWLPTPVLNFLHRSLLSATWTFFPEDESVIEPDKFEVLDENGDSVDAPLLNHWGAKMLNDALPAGAQPIEKAEISVQFGAKGWTMRSTESGAVTPVRKGVAKLLYSIELHSTPFKLFQYQERNAAHQIADAATAEVSMGRLVADVTVVYDKEKGGKIMFNVRDQEQASKQGKKRPSVPKRPLPAKKTT